MVDLLEIVCLSVLTRKSLARRSQREQGKELIFQTVLRPVCAGPGLPARKESYFAVAPKLQAARNRGKKYRPLHVLCIGRLAGSRLSLCRQAMPAGPTPVDRQIIIVIET